MQDATVHNCPSCQHVLTKAEPPQEFDWVAISQNATNGCKLFQWLERRAQQIYGDGPLAERRNTSGPISDLVIWLSRLNQHASEDKEPQYSMEEIYVTFEDRVREQRHIGEKLIVQAHEGPVAAKYVKSRPYIYDRESLGHLWKKWIDDCDSNHLDCLPNESVAPSRLIQISGNPTKPDINLYTVAEGARPRRYAALSYSWGGDQVFKTTRDRLNEYRSGISWDLLEPYATITDAIRVTYSLGIQYLWVDALCIIQDDDVDKAHELGRMGSIYTGATVTLRASMCLTSRDSFTSARLWHEELPICEILMPVSGGMAVPVQLIQAPEPGGLREPIDSRAWCSQEWLLSRRTLNFDSRLVWWKCPVGVRTDGGPISSRPGDISWLELVGKTDQSLGLHSPDEALEIWNACVKDYQARQLTIEADKLPAVAAVAEYVSRYIPGEYLTGLWSYKLPSQLLWSVLPPLPPVLRLRPPYRAPSWSWASVCDPNLLFHTEAPKETPLELVSYTSTPTFANVPFGAIKAASITIRGRLKEVSLQQGSVVDSTGINENRPEYPDSAFDPSFQVDTQEDEAYIQSAASIFMLEVVVCDNDAVFGLLLVPTAEGFYKRAGTFYIWVGRLEEHSSSESSLENYSERAPSESDHPSGEAEKEQLQRHEMTYAHSGNNEEPLGELFNEKPQSDQLQASNIPYTYFGGNNEELSGGEFDGKSSGKSGPQESNISYGYDGDDEEEPSEQELFNTGAQSEQSRGSNMSPSGSEGNESMEERDTWWINRANLVPGVEFFAGVDKIEITLI